MPGAFLFLLASWSIINAFMKRKKPSVWILITNNLCRECKVEEWLLHGLLDIQNIVSGYQGNINALGKYR